MTLTTRHTLIGLSGQTHDAAAAHDQFTLLLPAVAGMCGDEHS
ncbi:hypothetical protein [Nonomuraea rhizosphaerae]|nr:hypothetical protein [Nonomuraea rhizosphaerae]